MSQVIESDVWQSGPFQDGFEVLLDKAIHVHRSSKLRDENEIYSFRHSSGSTTLSFVILSIASAG
jgi:hypothetical protein